MNEKKPFSFRSRARSFVYAWWGIKVLVAEEHNARIHLVALAFAVIAGFVLHISPLEWCIIIMAAGAVISAEAVNSALEALADKISMEKHPLLGKAKDLGAAAVLILAIAALGVGMIIFIPKIIDIAKNHL